MKSSVNSFICAVAFCLFFCGCLAIPMRYPTKGPIRLDYKSFLPGRTTREELANAVKEGDTGVALRDAIWARWEKSNWGFLWGSYGGSSGSTRMASSENFIAEFDENGILKNWRIVGDDTIAGQLAPLICPDGSKCAREFMMLSAFHSHWIGRASGALELNKGYIEFKEEKAAGHSFRTKPSAIQAFITQKISHQNLSSRAIKAYLQIRINAKSSDKLEMELAPGALADLLSYLHEYAPGAVIWK